MSLTLKAGTRLYGAACTTEVVVVKAPADAVDLRIGGHPALTEAAGRTGEAGVDNAGASGPAMGKRYVDAAGTIELLCTKAGAGALTLAGEVLVQKDAKPLPASD